MNGREVEIRQIREQHAELRASLMHGTFFILFEKVKFFSVFFFFFSTEESKPRLDELFLICQQDFFFLFFFYPPSILESRA